ncbi:MAG: hypothetical protein SAL07_02445 [Oscillatoria sp. PMC 1051.18]|nr:hypothetical protein [Oscillatoria sp. PMC 1050.18]MEC5028746.1 hypothetical protein [Oscillatoria sp. PMC 1051.18]
MNRDTINLPISFASLLKAISSLDLQEKRQVWEMLDEEISAAEDELEEADPLIQAEIQEAKKAYQQGDYVTLETYIKGKSEHR